MKIAIAFEDLAEQRYRRLKNVTLWALITIVLATAIVCINSCTNPIPANAQTPPAIVKQIANAIYYAEGGAKTRYPYGILVKYKITTPRQACINTINHALRDWNGQGDFIVFLGSRYCPIGAGNDPRELNKNWVKNVRYYLTRIR